MRDLTPPPYLKVPVWRRGAALAIDLLAVGLLSSLIGGSITAVAFVFIVAWLGMRVIWVAKNQGQSLGRWALDMKVVDARIGGTPGLQELLKREAVVGAGAMLFYVGLLSLWNLGSGAAWALMLFIPLPVDCSFAYADRRLRQAFHDQISRTLVAQTRRGYSLDLKIKRLVAEAQRRVK
jgi:uncharacterized RDD family membrane protein YckC